MKKENLLVCIILVISFLAAPPVLADGWHTSDIYLHLYEPNQKAVISWNGQKETMILSSSVKSDDIANFAWVVPIQSSSKPEVSEGNISIFYDLVNYFNVPTPNDFEQTGVAGKGGVTVIETKEIDVYDITILKANNTNDLINWLNENGYKVPNEARPIIEKYVNKNDFYFIANKIDLSNKFNKSIKFLSDINKTNIYSLSQLYGSEGLLGIKNGWMSTLTGNILCNVSFEDYPNTNYFYPSNDPWVHLTLTTKEKYDELKNKYAITSDKNICQILSYHELLFSNMEDVDQYCFDENNNIVAIYGPEIESCDKCQVKSENCICNQIFKCNETSSIEYGAVGSIQELKKILNEYIPETRKNYELIYKELENNLDPRLDENLINETKELSNTLRDLRSGLSTPLKFEFQPDQPYYPLEISSLNIGDSHIEVYILTKDPVKDKNNILKVSESKNISSELEKKLKESIDIGNASYITRLTYDGNLKDLTKDAVFGVGSQNENENVFENIWLALQNLFDWIKSLFS